MAINDLKKIVDRIDEQTEGSERCQDMKVFKTVKATKEEIEMHAQMLKEADVVEGLISKLSSTRDKFWAKVQLRLDAFDGALSYNAENGEIEFRE